MNKKEKIEMQNIIVALDNLYILVKQMDTIFVSGDEIQTEYINKIKEYKEKLLTNLDVIEETKDSLLGLTQLKISSERFSMLFI